MPLPLNRTVPAVTLATVAEAGYPDRRPRPVIPANDALYLKDCDGCPFAGPGRALARECVDLCIHGLRLLSAEACVTSKGPSAQRTGSMRH